MKTITNRISHNYIQSDLVYPSLEEYKRVYMLDRDFVIDMLELHFNVDRIANKYVIEMPNGQLWHQFDSHTWLIEEVEDIPDCILGGFECNQEIRE